MWFTEPNIVFVISFFLFVLFTRFILDKIKKGMLNLFFDRGHPVV